MKSKESKRMRIEAIKVVSILCILFSLLSMDILYAQATQTFSSYCTNITCTDRDGAVACTCSEVNSDDSNYAGPIDAGPGAGINCDGGSCIITIDYFNLMPPNSIVVGSQIVANWYVKELGPNAPCRLEIYRNSTGTWHDVTTSCPESEATYYYNISSIISNQSDFEKITLRFNYTDRGEGKVQKILVDQAYATANYWYATKLKIWDETDTVPKNPGNTIMFWANFTNVTNGAPIDSGGICKLYLNLPSGWWNTSMNYNSTSGLYYYNWTSNQTLPVGSYNWNVSCNKDYYEQKNASDTFNLSMPPYVRTDAPNYTMCNIVFYKISVFDVNDNPIDSNLNISIINPSNVTAEQFSTTTGNGGTGVYLGNYIINATAQLGNWTIKAIADAVKNWKNFIVG